MSKTARYASISLCLFIAGTAFAAPEQGAPEAVVIGFVPAADPDVNAALLGGLRAGLAGHGVQLVVGRMPERWSNAAPETVRLVVSQHARVLVTPPGRRVAHLMAQVATKTQVPVVSTSTAPTVNATGSTWVTCVAQGEQQAAEPRDWTAVGERAARAALAHLAP